MYAAFSVNMVSRWLLAQGAVTRYRGEMLTLLEGNNASQLFDLFRFLTFVTLVMETIITLLFVWFTFKNRKDVE